MLGVLLEYNFWNPRCFRFSSGFGLALRVGIPAAGAGVRYLAEIGGIIIVLVFWVRGAGQGADCSVDFEELTEV